MPEGRLLRYEVKIPLVNESPVSVEALIRSHSMGFEEEHAARRVHNLYFDTPTFRCFTVNAAGVGRRVKLRLRWYGDPEPHGAGQLEWKGREQRLGWKETVPVTWTGRLDQTSGQELRSALRPLLPEDQRPPFDALPVATLYNTYTRRYFRSRDGRCRLTYDQELSFRAQIGLGPLSFQHGLPCRALQILEFKAPSDQQPLIRRALQGFPYAPSRCSKYSIGLRLFFGRGGEP